MTLDELAQAAHAQAVASGWYDGEGPPTPEAVAVRLALIHAEVSEVLEEVRQPDGDLSGQRVAEELADVVLRVADLAGWLEIDLARAIRAKAEKNAARPRRHGGKRL